MKVFKGLILIMALMIAFTSLASMVHSMIIGEDTITIIILFSIAVILLLYAYNKIKNG